MLESFDHVVVVMLENRSFDNILGYLYPNGVPATAPLGKSFNGVADKGLKNPIPANAPDNPTGQDYIKLGSTTDYHQPFPDPGETYPHVNTQLYNVIDGEDSPPYNLPPTPPGEAMQGFITDYIENFTENEAHRPPEFDEYAQIMRCFDPAAIPVLTILAEEFAVFDHWYCAVPSQTWCNRAFWNAGTSWGHVVNGGAFDGLEAIENSWGWVEDSAGTTLFNQIEDAADAALDWRIYTDNIIPLTGVIHFGALAPYLVEPHDHLRDFSDFLEDCRNGGLPSYSFVEPRFFNPHNDMHPSSEKGLIDGKQPVGSVLLGEHFVWQIYEAVKNSGSKTGSNWENTLLIITFDEHGGCYDHVEPPSGATPPDLSGYKKWMDFDYTRLGIRVPMIMVSANIAKNTIVNDRMDHTSFINTMQAKWETQVPGKFPALSARSAASPQFGQVFTSAQKRPPSDWPKIAEPHIPAEQSEIDFSKTALNELQQGITGAAELLSHYRKTAARPDGDRVPPITRKSCHAEAEKVLKDARDLLFKQ